MAHLEATPLRIAQTIGITLTAFTGSMNSTSNSVALPAVLENASGREAVRLWNSIYKRSGLRALSAIGVSFAVWGFALYHEGLSSPKAPLLATALVCNTCVVPYTVLFMLHKVNARLTTYYERAEKGEDFTEAEKKHIHEEITLWANHNWVRVGLSMSAALAGILSLW